MTIKFGLKRLGWGGGAFDKLLSLILVIFILGALGTLVYVVAVPRDGERFTEFYILGSDGKAIDYPSELKLGEEGKVVAGIVNHENELQIYRVEVTVGGVKSGEVGPIALNDEQSWEGLLSFIPDKVGNHQKVELLLFKNAESDAYLALSLWIDVNN